MKEKSNNLKGDFIMENEIMNEELVTVETEETEVKTSNNSGAKTAAIVGVSMLVGVLAYEKVIKPIGAKVKAKLSKKEEDDDFEDDDFEPTDESDEETKENPKKD